MGSDIWVFSAGESPTSFNSRSRMGSDYGCFPRGSPQRVSIHAPAWGATKPRWSLITECDVSIHAPAWGATGAPAARRGYPGRFNSRSRMGSDPGPWVQAKNHTRFQFTLPHGERPASTRPRSTAGGFQFTLPHGERLGRVVHKAHVLGFNSRSRMGSDAKTKLFAKWDKVSIHAPAWGATRHPAGIRRRRDRFNSRSRMGSDTKRGIANDTDLRFQFTLPHGERQQPQLQRAQKK